MRRLYLFFAFAAGALIVGIPLGLGIRNPHVRLPDFHGPPPELAEYMRDWNRAMIQARREQGRLNDFVVLVNHLSANYPFVELVARKYDIDHIELAVEVFDELTEVARDGMISAGVFHNFITERYLSIIGSVGGLRLTGEPREMHRWLSQPYFYGYYDWRFYDDRIDVPVRDSNVASELLDEGILYLRINSFVRKGYEPVTRNPFWYYCIDADKQYLMDLFNNLYGIEDLIIDIRGIGNGLRDYFVPLILAPHLHEPVTVRFYAFHADESFPNQVSRAYRTWYGLGDVVYKDILTQGFTYDLPENVTVGFPATITVQPLGNATFDGRIWLLTDSDNFSGPNFAYLQMARDAGFIVLYEEAPESIGWGTSFIHLPHSGLSLRFNPLYFTDDTGRSFEETGAVYDYRLTDVSDDFSEVLEVIAGRV